MTRIGLVGMGRFGKNYSRLLQTIEGVEFAGAVSRSVGSVEAFLKDPTIDALVIATPPQTHTSLALEALRSGKHVLVEKPAFLSSQEAEEVAEALKESGKVFMVGHQYLYNDHIRFLKKHIDDGSLGTIQSFFAEHDYPDPIKHADILWDAGVHMVAIADYLFKAPLYTASGGFSTGDICAFSLAYKAGMLFNFSGNRLATKKIRRFSVMGSKGCALYDEFEDPQKLRIYVGEESLAIPAHSEPLYNQLVSFVDSIRTSVQPLSGIEHALRVTDTLEHIADTLRKPQF